FTKSSRRMWCIPGVGTLRMPLRGCSDLGEASQASCKGSSIAVLSNPSKNLLQNLIHVRPPLSVEKLWLFWQNYQQKSFFGDCGISPSQEQLPYDVRHPVILPRRHWITRLIVKDYHEKANHNAGVNFILSQINEKYWIIAAREEIREWENQYYVSPQGVRWLFNPPAGPHFGGAHEILVKAAKKAIYSVLGSSDVNDEELITIFTEAEGLLNSRPLSYQSADRWRKTSKTARLRRIH
ncbi:Hypothetical predicted protein, partial [Paramuricea clavata]